MYQTLSYGFTGTEFVLSNDVPFREALTNITSHTHITLPLPKMLSFKKFQASMMCVYVYTIVVVIHFTS